jgi:hypothetical protein
MSTYQLQQLVFDQLRAWAKARDAALDPTIYDLTAEEQEAFTTRDVGGLYRLGVHSVLVNAFCRAIGHTRDDYRRLLDPYRVPSMTVPRWRRSS